MTRSFHLKNMGKSMLLAGSMLMLSACASYDLDNMQDLSVTLEDETEELVNEFNTLYDLETELLSTFESDLDADQDLATFNNNNAAVFENVSQREETLSSITDLNKNLIEHADFLANYDSAELNPEEPKALSNQLTELTDVITSYTTDYTTALENQTTYFESLGKNDATAETFIDGIDHINNEHEQLFKQSKEINESFGETLSELESFKQTVDQAMAEGE